MSQPYSQWKVAEMSRMSASPLAGLGLVTTPPVYYADNSGKPINGTTIPCGNAITFQVPGYTKIWLKRYKNGTLDFDAMFDVPMALYQTDCARDGGSYKADAYDPNSMALIGSAELTITGGSIFGGLSTTTLLLIGAAAFFLLKKK